MKEKILETFSRLGFKLEKKDDLGYKFNYECSNFIYIPEEEDDSILVIGAPDIYNLDDGSPKTFLTLMNKINTNLSYVKTFACGKSLWLFYERKLIGEEDLMKVIPHMIRNLNLGLKFTIKAVEEINAKNENESSNEK